MPDTSKARAADPVAAVLAEIRRQADDLSGPRYLVAADVYRLLAALDAVLGLHAEAVVKTKPELPDIHCCAECGELWPCPTVAAISRALTGEEAAT